LFWRRIIETVFKKIKLQKVTEEIAEQIRGLINEGKLQPGEKLPPERIFSEMLGVGRSSLREAINILETQGFVEARKRQGVYIRSLGSPIIVDPIRKILEEDKEKLLHLYEVRTDVELASAFKAARFRTDEDLALMEQYMERMEKAVADNTLDLQDDLAFHLSIAKASNNVLRSHILKSIFELSTEYLHFVVGIVADQPGRVQRLLEQHRNIYTAIKAKDQEKARQMMEDHLLWVEGQWKKNIKGKQD
jgi:GntR family transcriptional repressor for pyruvate dehydrogenase complex